MSTHAQPVDSAEVAPVRTIRLWFPVTLLAVYWAFTVLVTRLDWAISTTFLSTMGISLLVVVAFLIWWLTNGRVPRTERVWAFLALTAAVLIASRLADPSIGPIGMGLVGLPVLVSIWTAWLLVSRRFSSSARLAGVILAIALGTGMMTLVRTDGIDGDNKAAVSMRWRPTAEDDYVNQRAQTKTTTGEAADDQPPIEATAGDWTEFRGPNRQGELHGERIESNWTEHSPKELWRRRIGPAWSSVLIVGDRLYTQEQRGEQEATVCLDATSGSDLWSHDDHVRFSDGQAGAGPRGTPTFADGKIFGLGATGVLNCLDARTGKRLWTRNIVDDSGAALPMWGFSSSPLVVDGTVVVYAGGPESKGRLGYRADSGEPAWAVATGPVSYSSPQAATIDGRPQVWLLSDAGIVGVEPSTGKILWKFDVSGNGVWRVAQPRQLDDTTLLVGSEDLGLTKLKLARDGETWTAAEDYKSKAIRPAYNDFVLHDGHVYGFDEAIFCCVDVATGKRKWKAGRYGHGQVLLLVNQALLLVVTERGEVVLVSARPDKHEEPGRFQAVSGKTWNHPVVARGRLYVRNDTEMACFDVAPHTP